MMRCLSLAAALFAAHAAPAQTTGVAGVNNLTMMLPPTYTPAGGGTVSCTTFVTTGAAGTNVVAFSLDAPTAGAAWLLISPLGCVPQFFPFLPTAAAGCAGPPAGTPLTNLWLSLVVGGPWPLPLLSISPPPGPFRWNFNLTWPIPPVYVQGFMLDLCSPTGFKFSQAMGFQ
jgi:hypothetical protein